MTSGTKPSTEWPYKGQIVFQNFYLSYFPSSSHAIENLNIKIESMEKVIKKKFIIFDPTIHIFDNMNYINTCRLELLVEQGQGNHL